MLPPLAALDSVTLIGLADDCDVGLGVSGMVDVSSGSDGDKSGNEELKVYQTTPFFNKISNMMNSIYKSDVKKNVLTSCMVLLVKV